MGQFELAIRIAFGIGATLYFCLPTVTLTVAMAFGAAAVLLLLTLVLRRSTPIPGFRDAGR